MAKRQIGKPVRGIDQLSDETSLLKNQRGQVEALREGLNLDIDKDGNCGRRGGYTQKLSGIGYHSFHKAKRGWLMLCHNEELGTYVPSSNTFTVLENMTEAQLTSFAEANGNLYAVNPAYTGYFPAGSVVAKGIGVSLPAVIPSFAVSANGGLDSGTYGISYSFVDADGEESGLGAVITLELPSGGGVQGSLFTVAAGHKYRIYMTTTDGEELYQAAEFDADVASYHISDHEEGRLAVTHGLEPLPFGQIIREHNSRLYIASTGAVFYSDAFRPHLYNSSHNFLPMTGFVTMVQPVDTGIFIADSLGVRFYRGGDPTEFEVKDVSTETVVFNTPISVPGEFLPEEIGTSDIVAVWLASSGMHVGLPSGEVVRLHAHQVQLPNYVQGCSALAVRDGKKQLIMPVRANTLTGTGVALDSVTDG